LCENTKVISGINDKTLAEFVVNLHDESTSLQVFERKLREAGAEFPDTVVKNLDRLILRMHPMHKKSQAFTNTGRTAEKDKNTRMFPGLALPNQDWKPSVESIPTKEKDPVMKEVDDLMSQLEQVGKKSRSRASVYIESPNGHSPKRQRTERTPSPKRRRSRSPRRGRVESHPSRYTDRDSHQTKLDSRPILYKIYNGRVSGVRDFGAFVTLEGVSGKTEGENTTTNFNSFGSMLSRNDTRLRDSTRGSS
jgi:ATP-dependent RNA helicase DHX8/PRP22